MNSSARRIDAIDIIKGIGIILVVFGHIASYEQYPRMFVYAFHMPLFFLFSGFVSKPSASLKSGLKKSFFGLYIPYLVFVTIDVAAYYICNPGEGITAAEFLRKLGLVAVGLGKPLYNPPLWFLFTLFVIKVFFTIITSTKFKKAFITAALILSVIFCFLYERFDLDTNIMYLRAVFGFPFFAIGFLLKDYILRFINAKTNLILLFVFMTAALAILIFTCRQNSLVNIYQYRIGNPVLYFANALLGIVFTLILSIIIDRIFAIRLTFVKRFLIYLGQNSVYILAVHCYLTRRLYPFLFGVWGLSEQLYSYYAEIILLIVTIILMVPVIMFFDRYLYFLFGKTKYIGN